MSLRSIAPLLLLACVPFAACSSESPAAAQAQPAQAPAAPQANIDLERKMRTEVMRGDYEEILKRRYLRVLVVPDRLTFFFDNGQMGGTAYEGMMEFERLQNLKNRASKLPLSVVFIPVRRDQAFQMLSDGRGDIAVGRFAITDEARKHADFTIPLIDDTRAVLVTGPSAPVINKPEDLAGKEIFLPPAVQTELAGPLNARLKQQGLPPIRPHFMDENLRVDDVLEMVNAGLTPMTAVEIHVAQIWSSVLKDLKVRTDIELGSAPIGWAVRKGTPKLQAELNEFVKTHKVGTAYGSTVMRRYYNNPKWVRQATSPEDAAKFKQMLALFEKYGKQYDLPYLLVAAQAYQESRLNQNLKSSAGAVGVMQIKPSTAAGNPINVTPVTTLENNIKAGVKYLRYIADEYFKDPKINQVNRALFAVASYNAGPNRIERLRAEAKASGFDENAWFNNVEVIVSRRIGRETTNYVANIYKYYLAYKQITEVQGAAKASPAKGAAKSAAAK